jgi:hypothetical protein
LATLATGCTTQTIGLSTAATERLRITATGAWGLNGANFGTSGQALLSTGSSSAPTWGTVTINANALTGTTLASNVVGSSLTSVGTLTSLTVSGASNLAATTVASGLTLAGANALTVDGSTGTTGQVLTSNGSGVSPTWQTPTSSGGEAPAFSAF